MIISADKYCIIPTVIMSAEVKARTSWRMPGLEEKKSEEDNFEKREAGESIVIYRNHVL